MNKESTISWNFQREFNKRPVFRGVVRFMGINTRCQASNLPTIGSPILEEREVMEVKFGKSWTWKLKGKLLNRSCYHWKMPLPDCRQRGRLRKILQLLFSSHTEQEKSRERIWEQSSTCIHGQLNSFPNIFPTQYLIWTIIDGSGPLELCISIFFIILDIYWLLKCYFKSGS